MSTFVMSHSVNPISIVAVTKLFSRLYAVFTYTFTIRIDLYLFAACLLSGIIVSCFVIHKYNLTAANNINKKISTATAEATPTDLQHVQKKAIRNTDIDETGSGFLDNFLKTFFSSMKTFEYLEKDVLEEITRYAQIRNLPKEDVLWVDEATSFYVVVRGSLNIYIQEPTSTSSDRPANTASRAELLKDYTLIKQVEPGEPASSLFTVLSLFCKCHEKSEQKKHRREQLRLLHESNEMFLLEGKHNACSDSGLSDHHFSIYDMNDSDMKKSTIKHVVSEKLPQLTKLDERQRVHQKQANVSSKQLHKSSIAYAATTTDVVLAVIPKRAFFKIYQDFPESASRMIRLILARFQSISIMTSRHYFGLDKQILQLEYQINKQANVLPTSEGCEEEKDSFNELIHLLQGKQLMFPIKSGTTSDSQYIREKLARCFMNCFLRFKDMKYQLKRKNVLSSLEAGVQVLNFQRGSILLKEGGKDHGVFLVMDGALEAFVTNIDSQSNIHKQQKSDFDDSLSNFIIIDDRKVAYRYPYGRISHQDDVIDENSRILFTIGPGQTAGYFSALTKQASTFGIRAKSDCIVGYFSPACIRNIVHHCPPAMIELSKRVLNCMKPLFMHIDISLQLVQMSAGQVICNKDNPTHSAFVVQYGRLKKTQVSKDQDRIEISQEYSKGDSTDELEFLIKSDVSTAIPSTWTLNAMQDSGVICIPKTLISAFTLCYPQIPLRLSRRAADQTLSVRPNETHLYQPDEYQQFPDDLRSSISSCNSSINQYTMISGSFRNSKRPARIVALIPISDHVSLRAFAEHLKSALIESVGAKCALVTRSIVKTACKGAPISSKVGRHRLALKLAELEENEHVVLYAADYMMNGENQSKKLFWTQTCMRQANCVLFIANADDNPLLTGYEHMLLDLNKTARKELVLLHSTKLCVPGTTNAWLKNRTWVEAHHHIMMPIKRSTAQVESSSIKYISIIENLKNGLTCNLINKWMPSKLRNTLVKYRGILRQQKDHKNSSHHSSTTIDKQVRADFARLSRRLCRKAVALVLGGGNSTRGIIKYITMINALEETGIPIDIIGGTNVGSLVSACYAKNANRLLTVGKLKAFVRCLNSPWRYILQFTHLFITKSTGHILNRMIQDCIGKDVQIEDFWLPSFAVTTDIAYSYMKVHTTGDAWKYIHTSMSLPGQNPPLVDSDESMLMHERYSDHFPLAVAKDMGADLIIAVDISSSQKESFKFGGILSVLYAFCRNSILSVLGLASVKGKMFRIPNINQMQIRLSSVLDVNILQAAKTTEGVLYVNLPCATEKYSQIFTSDDIYQESINITRRIVSEWNKHGFASGRISS